MKEELTEARTLNNSAASTAKQNVSDLEVWGDPDAWWLISKASSVRQGWMKTTKAMLVEGVGVVLQTETRESLGVSQSTVLIPDAYIEVARDDNRVPISRRIAHSKCYSGLMLEAAPKEVPNPT